MYQISIFQVSKELYRVNKTTHAPGTSLHKIQYVTIIVFMNVVT